MRRWGWLAMGVGMGCQGDPGHDPADRATYQQVVADRRVPLGAGAEALFPRRHLLFMFAAAPRQPFLRRRVLFMP